MRVLVFLTFLLSLSVPFQASGAERYALLIGNQNYKPANSNIDQAPHDVQVIGGALELLGFQVITLKDADRATILSAVNSLAQQLNAAKSTGGDLGAIGLLYYSGHAVRLAEKGPNYLIPVDVERFGADQIKAKGIPLSDILTTLTTTAASAAHFVLIDGARMAEAFDASGLPGGLAPETGRPGVLIAFSNQPAHGADGSNEKASIFASRLARRLVSAPSDHSKLFKDFQTFCANQTQNRQIPWIKDGIAQSVSLPSPSFEPIPDEGGPIAQSKIAWNEKPGKTTIIFNDWARFYAQPRVDSPIIREVHSMFHIMKVAKGTSISVGVMGGIPAWFRFTPADGKGVEHYIPMGPPIELR